tara:strand:- start:1876 stop:2127 length:252 start_codon:yes stop_codon:yes gene_type:complete
MIYIDIFGWLGGILLTLNLIPQIYKVHITKKIEDISTTFIIVNVIGLLLYSIYGLYYEIYQVAISSLMSLCISLYLLYLKLIL